VKQSTSIAFAPLRRPGLGVLRSEILSAGERALRAARDGWPVDTGRSRDALALDFKADGFIIISTADYAPFINRGRAVDEAAQRVARILENEVEIMADRILSALR
jgi:hypothetical protein